MTARAEQVLPPGYRRLILVDPAAAAYATGRSERTLRRWAATGRLTRHGTDHRPRYDYDELPTRGGSLKRIG